jgi:hypothetical protein
VPVRTTVAGLTVAVAGVTAAMAFAASVDHLTATPRLSGWNWDVAAALGPVDPALAGPVLEREPGVDGFAPGTFFRPFPAPDHALELGPGRVPVDILGFAADATVGPTVLDGRAPADAGEILLGRETLHELGLHIGDDVRAVARVGGDGEHLASLEEVSGRFEIVGTGVVPISGGRSRLGRGAVLTIEGIQSLNPEATPDVVYVRFTSGTDPRRVLSRLASGLSASGEPADAEAGPPGGIIGFQLGSEVLNVREVEDLPLLLAVVIAVLGTAVLAHFLVTAVRTRRRDLAVLRALGCTGRQLRTVVTTEGVVLALVSTAVGIPVGVIIGRWVWRTFALRLGVAPEPAVAVVALAGLGAAVVALAALLTVLPARWAARSRPGPVLRAE